MSNTTPIRFDDIDLTRIKGVLLDLDDTLYRYDPCHSAALTASFKFCDFDLPFEVFQSRYRTARDAITRTLTPQGACRSRLFAFMMMTEEANMPQGYAVACQLDEVYWSNFIAAMAIDPDAMTFLKRCAAAQIRTCIVTDMTAQIQIRKIARLGIGRYIDRLVTSEEVGAEKPDSRMFLTAVQKLGVPLEHCIMLGDSTSKDIKGAETLGMKAFLVRLDTGSPT